jgi:hypothetical protein
MATPSFREARSQITGDSWLDDLARASLSAAEAKRETPVSCRCRALIVPAGDGGPDWRAVSGERPGDFWCPGGQLHRPANLAGVFPLTCDWCKSEPATHLAVYDVTAHDRTHRVQKVIGDACVSRDWHHAPEVAVSPRSAWLFRLVPDTKEG